MAQPPIDKNCGLDLCMIHLMGKNKPSISLSQFKILQYAYVCILLFIPLHEISGSLGMCMCNFIKYCSVDFQVCVPLYTPTSSV